MWMEMTCVDVPVCVVRRHEAVWGFVTWEHLQIVILTFSRAVWVALETSPHWQHEVLWGCPRFSVEHHMPLVTLNRKTWFDPKDGVWGFGVGVHGCFGVGIVLGLFGVQGSRHCDCKKGQKKKRKCQVRFINYFGDASLSLVFLFHSSCVVKTLVAIEAQIVGRAFNKLHRFSVKSVWFYRFPLKLSDAMLGFLRFWENSWSVGPRPTRSPCSLSEGTWSNGCRSWRVWEMRKDCTAYDGSCASYTESFVEDNHQRSVRRLRLVCGTRGGKRTCRVQEVRTAQDWCRIRRWECPRVSRRTIAADSATATVVISHASLIWAAEGRESSSSVLDWFVEAAEQVRERVEFQGGQQVFSVCVKEGLLWEAHCGVGCVCGIEKLCRIVLGGRFPALDFISAWEFILRQVHAPEISVRVGHCEYGTADVRQRWSPLVAGFASSAYSGPSQSPIWVGGRVPHAAHSEDVFGTFPKITNLNRQDNTLGRRETSSWCPNEYTDDILIANRRAVSFDER